MKRVVGLVLCGGLAMAAGCEDDSSDGTTDGEEVAQVASASDEIIAAACTASEGDGEAVQASATIEAAAATPPLAEATAYSLTAEGGNGWVHLMMPMHTDAALFVSPADAAGMVHKANGDHFADPVTGRAAMCGDLAEVGHHLSLIHI